ncbi:MAG: cation transporting ATPase C-terminal domain-containing protein, partial [Firmicutes bacterium]|nr:cation transporting ATPase C-terminal domain-containing protein [Bacillota bacterium]
VKAADVGIAMGRSGTEVCKEAADIVILNDSFSTVVSAVKWGRGIYENFQRFILFQLTVNFSAVAVTVAYILLGLGAPFNALQLLWINIIMDGPPALTLGLEPVGEGLLTRKPVGRNDHIITKKMAYRIFVNVAFITVLLLTQGITNFMGIEASKERTFIFALFIIFQLFNAFNARELGRQSILKTLTRNKPMLIVMAITFVLQIVIVQSAGAFGTVPLSFSDWLKIFAAGFSVIAFNELYKALVRRMPRRAATRRGHPAKKAGGLSHEVHNPIGG